MKLSFSKILPSAGALAMLLSGPAFAQDNAAAEGEDEIVVTGTSIRGIAPAGSSVIGLSEEDIQASGAMTTNDLLSELPMAGNFFNTVVQPGAGPGIGANAFVVLPRVQLRPLPGSNQGSGMQTLVLVDGHRLTPLGISTQLGARIFVDSNLIPPGLNERVEVITDGGSAIYGSDAITGVMNFITRRRYDGVAVNGSVGFADGYTRWSHGITAGTDWGSGSIFGSYNYSQSDALFGSDRDWIRDYTGALTADPADDIPGGRQCASPTITVEGRFFLPDNNFAEASAPNACDTTDTRGYAPETYRYSFAGGFSQDLSETIRFDLRGLVARAVSINYNGPFSGPVTITSANPYFHPLVVPGDPLNNPNASQSVAFNFSPVFGTQALKQNTTEDLWQITPEVTWDLPGDWQFRGLVSQGESELAFENAEINGTALTAAGSSNNPLVAINPYDIASSSREALLGLLRTNSAVGHTRMRNARAIFDGPLVQVPGGQVRTAVGAEYLKTDFDLRTTPTGASALGPESHFEQDVSAVFAELHVPIASEDNNIPFVHALDAHGSIRRDSYSDFGDTTNAAYGLTYQPVEWFTLYGNYSESFVAPSAAEQAGAGQGGFTVNTVAGSTDMPGGGENVNAVITITGSVTPLQPQTSESYTFGFDVRPPWIEGLSLRASFWHTLLMGRLGSLSGCALSLQSCMYNVFEPGDAASISGSQSALVNYLVNPSSADIAALAALLDPDAASDNLEPYIDTGSGASPVDLILDFRTANLGRNLVEGWDFGANYTHPTSWGSWDARFSMTLFNLQRGQSAPGGAWANLMTATTSDYNASAAVGANIGNFRAQASVTDSAGRMSPNGRVDSFHPVDVFFSYDVDGQGWGEDLRFTLNVDNVFDEEPTGLRQLAQNGFTLGRLVQVGVSKRF